MRIRFVVMVALLSVSLPAVCQTSDNQGMRFVKEYVGTRGIDSLMEFQTTEVRKNLPIRQSELEQIVAITYLPSSRTQMWKHVLASDALQRIAEARGISASEVVKLMPSFMGTQAINTACSQALGKYLLGQGVSMEHVYYDADGRYVFTISVDEKKCLTAANDNK